MKPVAIFAGLLLPALLTAADPAIATYNGKALPEAEVRRLLDGLAPERKEEAAADPEKFLREHFVRQALAAAAVKKGLESKTPYRQRLDWLRRQVLMQARLNQVEQALELSEQSLRETYQKQVLRYRWARARVILIRFNPAPDKPIDPGGKLLPGEPEARAKAEELLRRVRAGEDFAELAKQYSDHEESAVKGGQFDEVRGDGEAPWEVRETVLQLAQGEVSEILQSTNGFYIFKAEEVGQHPFEVVRGGLEAEVRAAHAAAWLRKRMEAYPVRFERGELLAALAKDPGAKLDPETGPDTPIADAGGRVVTVSKLSSILDGAPESVLKQAAADPQHFLSQFFVMEEEAAAVASEGLDRKSPFQERLEQGRMEVLARAGEADFLAGLAPGEEQLRQAYKATLDRYRWALVKLLRVSIGMIPSPRGSDSEHFFRDENEAVAKVFSIQLQLRDGAGFTELIREHSEDPPTARQGGDFGPVMMDTPNVPDEAKKAILALREGEYSNPVILPFGVFLFRAEKTGAKPFAEVRAEVESRYREQRLEAWIEEIRRSIDVKVSDKGFFEKAAAGQL